MSSKNSPKPFPIGISDFQKLRDGGYAYVDKSLFIQKVLDKGTEAALFVRPRRFGKTLNLSMLYYFFAKSDKDTSYLFKDLLIWKQEKCRELQGYFPVVFLSLKDIKHSTFERATEGFRKVIAKEYAQHSYLLQGSLLTEKEQRIYSRIVNEEDDPSLLEDSLAFLSEWLFRYHQRRVILLIDEYAAPMHKAYMHNYYAPLIEL